MCRSGLSTKDNERRPGRYILLQKEEERVFGTVEDSLTAGYAFKKRFGNRRCQDVLSEGEGRFSLNFLPTAAVSPLRAPTLRRDVAAQKSEVQPVRTQCQWPSCVPLDSGAGSFRRDRPKDYVLR